MRPVSIALCSLALGCGSKSTRSDADADTDVDTDADTDTDTESGTGTQTATPSETGSCVVPDGCGCYDDADCWTDRVCRGGSCEMLLLGRCVPPLLPGECWAIEDCGEDSVCEGACICPCDDPDCNCDCDCGTEPGVCVSDGGTG